MKKSRAGLVLAGILLCALLSNSNRDFLSAARLPRPLLSAGQTGISLPPSLPPTTRQTCAPLPPPLERPTPSEPVAFCATLPACLDGDWTLNESAPALYALTPPAAGPHHYFWGGCEPRAPMRIAQTSYEWTPRSCRLRAHSALDVCRRLAGETILYVGDSLQGQMYRSAVELMRDALDYERELPVEFHCGGVWRTENISAQPFDVHKEAVFCNRTLRFVFSRHEFVDTQRFGCLPFPYTHKPNRWGQRWTQHVENATVVVLNRGLHIRARIVEDVKKTLNFVLGAPLHRNNARDERPRVVVWRTTDASLPDCTLYSSPLRAAEAIEHFLQHLERLRGEQRDYGWQRLEPQNRQIRELIRATPAFQRRVLLLDIYRMTLQRPDDHSPPHRHGDCSHWCLPGTPDWWNRMLWHAL